VMAGSGPRSPTSHQRLRLQSGGRAGWSASKKAQPSSPLVTHRGSSIDRVCALTGTTPCTGPGRESKLDAEG
jgi:hypothetical protein